MSALQAKLRSCSVVSTSYTSPSSFSRQRLMVRAADDGFCRDKVNLPREPFKSKGAVYKLTFVAGNGETRVVDCPDDKYILDAAEAGGLDLPATCRGGICGACVARVAKGKVDQSDIADLSFTVSDDEIAKGMTLICMARAESDLEIEIQSDWGYSLGDEWKGATGKFSHEPVPLMIKK